MLINKYMSRVMWSACFLAAISSVTYPAISSFVSIHSDADKQGLKLFFKLHKKRITIVFYFCI